MTRTKTGKWLPVGFKPYAIIPNPFVFQTREIKVFPYLALSALFFH